MKNSELVVLYFSLSEVAEQSFHQGGYALPEAEVLDRGPRPRQLWRRRRNVLLFLIVAVLVFDGVVNHLIQRVSAPIFGIVEFRDGPSPPYVRLRANASEIYEGMTGTRARTHMRINALGFRGADRDVRKAANVRRIVAIGDSHTFGLGVEEDEALPAQLERELRESGYPGTEVWNLGTPSNGMADHLGTLQERALPLKPDAILLQLTSDDSRPAARAGPVVQALLRWSGIAKVAFAATLMIGTDPEGFRRDYLRFLEDCAAAGIPVLVWIESFPEGTAQFLPQLNQERRIPTYVLGKLPKLENDPHLSAEGYAIVAKDLFPLVKDLLRKRLEQTALTH